jgi:hypothetical protein
MGSPRCTLNRWGTGAGSGTSCYTPKTEEAKEMEDKLKKMMAEREKIDTMWMTSTNPNNNTKTDK